MIDDLIQQAVDLQRERDHESPAVVIRYALVAEVMEPEAAHPCIDIVASENLTAWQAKGLSWSLEQQAIDVNIIDQE